MLAQRRRRWTNINPTLVRRLVFAGISTHLIQGTPRGNPPPPSRFPGNNTRRERAPPRMRTPNYTPDMPHLTLSAPGPSLRNIKIIISIDFVTLKFWLLFFFTKKSLFVNRLYYSKQYIFLLFFL